jgi:glycosyltransferase involved in cell wall biosynthesis
VGTFGEWHGVEVLARAVKPTIERNSRVHFLLIGDGKLRGTVEEILRADSVQEHVTMLGLVPHSLVPKYLSLCEVLLSPHTHNPDGTVFFGSPTKLFE